MTAKLFEFAFLFFILLFFGGLAWLEVLAVRRWKGVWRIPACLPGLIVIGVIANIVVGILHNPTSHNLWPFEILLWSAGGIAFLGFLKFLRSLF